MHPELGHSAMFALGVSAETQRRLRLLNAAVQLWPDAESAAGDSECDEFHATLVLRAEQRPNRQSRVTLGEHCDALGVPMARLNWELDPEDWQSICATARIVAATLTEHAGARVDLVVSEQSPWPDLPSHLEHCNPWGCHHMGTTRMSSDPQFGVVDRNAKVHGMRNLFVAGSSVFPTGGYANPTFTVIALSLRTAEHLMAVT
jgi:choline dehydrogenase-like flavoprotein